MLTDFINTGVYDRNRTFHATTSPSMDILISSNLERLLYHLYDGDNGACQESNPVGREMRCHLPTMPVW